MCGRPPLGKGFQQRSGDQVTFIHVYGLLRAEDAFPAVLIEFCGSTSLAFNIAAFSSAHAGALWVVRRIRDDLRPSFDPDDVDCERPANFRDVRGHQRHREALADRMAIAARCDKPDDLAAAPDWFITGGVGIGRVDLKRDERPLRREPFPFGLRRLPADELAFFPRDPAIQPGHPRRVGLRELGGPDAAALFQAQRVESDEAVFSDAEIPRRLEQPPAQSRMVERRAVYLVAELTGDREAGGPAAGQPHVPHDAATEAPSGPRDVHTGETPDPIPQR